MSDMVEVLMCSLAGRCASGEERGAGRLIHAVPASQARTMGRYVEVNGAAICGAKPGRRSVGWTPGHSLLTCKRCLSKLGRKDENA